MKIEERYELEESPYFLFRCHGQGQQYPADRWGHRLDAEDDHSPAGPHWLKHSPTGHGRQSKCSTASISSPRHCKNEVQDPCKWSSCLAPGKGGPWPQCKLGQLCWEGPGSLDRCKLNLSPNTKGQQNPGLQDHKTAASRSREAVISLCSALILPPADSVSCPWGSNTRKTLKMRSELSWGPPRWWARSIACPVRRGWGTRASSGWRIKGWSGPDS